MNPDHATTPGWLFRLLHPDAETDSRSGAPSTRLEVCPPQAHATSAHGWQGRWQRLRQRLGDAAALAIGLERPTAPLNQLTAAKSEFQMLMADLADDDTRRLALRVDRARCLRELWHLRMAFYGVVAQSASQAEADRRLALLNRHFPVRSARSALHADSTRASGPQHQP